MRYCCKNCGGVFTTERAITTPYKYRCPACGACFDWNKIKIPNYETPEQYEKRTGKPYPKDGAVWARTVEVGGKGKGGWYCACLGFHDAKNTKFPGMETQIVCSVTKPPSNWRPPCVERKEVQHESDT